MPQPHFPLRILVIKYGAIGDFVAGTMAITALRKAHPSAHITLLTNARNKAICPPGTLVDAVLIKEEVLPSKKAYFSLWRRLRNRFDLVLNLRWTSEINALLAVSIGAKQSAGISESWIRRLYTHTVPPVADFYNRHEYEKNLDVVRALGIKADYPEGFIHISAPEQDGVDEYLAQHRIDRRQLVIMCPTASSPLKSWPQERFTELGRRIAAAYPEVRILVPGVGAERSISGAVAEGIGEAALHLPEGSIGSLAAFVKAARLNICNNSGSHHISFAVGTPVICFNNSIGWMPYGPDNVALSAYPTEAGFNHKSLGDAEVHELLLTISVDAAWEAFQQKWAQLQQQPLRQD